MGGRPGELKDPRVPRRPDALAYLGKSPAVGGVAENWLSHSPQQPTGNLGAWARADAGFDRSYVAICPRRGPTRGNERGREKLGAGPSSCEPLPISPST
jgi:hypothetical protein